MFRLVKFPIMRGSRSSVLVSQFPTKVCSLCGINNVKMNPNLNKDTVDTSSKRDNSTITNNLFVRELEKRRKLRKDKRYFTELLEVYRNSSNEVNIPVNNMKAIDFPVFAEMADLKFTRSPRVKKKSNNNVRVTGTLESKNKKLNNFDSTKSTVVRFSESFTRKVRNKNNDLNSKNKLSRQMCTNGGDFSDDGKLSNVDKMQKLKLHKINDLLNSLHRNNIPNVLNDPPVDHNFQEDITEEFENQEETIEPHTANIETTANGVKKPKPIKRKKSLKPSSKEKLAKDKLIGIEKKCKEETFNSTLLTFIKLCVSCNLLQRGIATLHYYTYKSKMSVNNPKVTNVNIFEELMKGFAAKGNQSKVDELWKLLISCGLEPSLGVFVSQLECAVRSQKDKHRVPEIIKSLRIKGYELQQIFVETEFLGDQREVLLNALGEVEPDFKPLAPTPNICYSCSLLKEINDQEKSCNIKSPVEGVLNKTDLQKLSEEQFNNEFAFYLKVKSIEKRIEPEEVLKLNRQKLDAMRNTWMKDLKTGFERDLIILQQIKKNYCISLLPYLKVLSVQSYVDIMLKEIQRLAEGSETFSPTTLQLYRGIGSQVKNRYIVKFKKTHGIVDKTKMLYGKYCDWYSNPSNKDLRSKNGRQEWQHLLHDHQEGPTLGGEDEYWPPTVLLGIGRFLYNIIIGDVKVDVNILNKLNKEQMLPGFYRVYRQQGVKCVEEIKPHPVISKLFRAAGEEHIHFDITLVPMVSPPLPWTTHQSGGYLMSKTDIIRLPDQALQQRVRLKEAPPEQLFPPLDSLNQLGSIPWRVNTPVLDTVIEVFNSGGSAKLDIPEPPHASSVLVPVHPDMSRLERFQAYRQRLILRRQKAEMYSLWCDALYKLSLANHFRDKIFWLPHNMDFRGRVYPCPPHLNHLGADMSRSLLQFAQGKPLGPDGLNWLKIHLVNLLGTKKRDSIQGRLDYANTIMCDILDSADYPLSGKKWWMESETPWQTLACCVEIRNALQHSGGPQHFVSHFPIHQDGSCNGLQHYAALGRDEAGAASVNLLPQDLPQDVYSCVAALVEQARIKDSAMGNKVAKELDGYVRRKVIKQTVMTTVYGVTRFGARLQIAKQLKDIDSFPKDCVWPASAYLVVKTFDSLQEMFTSTKEIQDWFTECARLISQTRGENVEYVTPLGLPVVQHYSRMAKRYDYNSSKLGYIQEYFPSDIYEKPNVMKQKNAFPPNFIHSLDSTHMMLTSIVSEQRGITFVSVHDCYWTHACTVPIMNQICREQFVALHSQPILEDLSTFLLDKYDFNIRERMEPNSSQVEGKQRLHTVLSQVPSKGTFILEHVLDSIYFFS